MYEYHNMNLKGGFMDRGTQLSPLTGAASTEFEASEAFKRFEKDVADLEKQGIVLNSLKRSH